MKKHTTGLRLPQLFLFATLTSCLLSICFINAGRANNEIVKSTDKITPVTNIIFMPDSTNQDSIVQYEEGDTVETYITGWDSVYVLYEDTTNDSISPFAWDIPFETEHMLIELTEYHHEIEQGLFGVNVSDLFETRHANEFELSDYATGESPWDYLVALKPKVLRFPSGSGGKFMQPLGSLRTADYDPEPSGSMNGGYGFNIEEIIAFYDATAAGAAPPLFDGGAPGTSISEDMEDNECNNCGTWMNVGDYEDDFEGFYRKWKDQPVFDPTGLTTEEMDDLYVNSFIRLVDRIEDENDYEVDVIVCLNILNQTATECVDLIDYLLNNTISRVHVVGVELGNEVYFKFGADAM